MSSPLPSSDAHNSSDVDTSSGRMYNETLDVSSSSLDGDNGAAEDSNLGSARTDKKSSPAAINVPTSQQTGTRRDHSQQIVSNYYV